LLLRFNQSVEPFLAELPIPILARRARLSQSAPHASASISKTRWQVEQKPERCPGSLSVLTEPQACSGTRLPEHLMQRLQVKRSDGNRFHTHQAPSIAALYPRDVPTGSDPSRSRGRQLDATAHAKAAQATILIGEPNFQPANTRLRKIKLGQAAPHPGGEFLSIHTLGLEDRREH